MNIAALCEHCNVKEEDVLVAKWTSTPFDPGHYVVLDHNTKSIVFAVRGTFHLRDCLTDLVAHHTPFLEGHAHAVSQRHTPEFSSLMLGFSKSSTKKICNVGAPYNVNISKI